MIPAVLPTYARAPMTFVKGEGSWLVDDKGRRFADLGGGIAVNALGHAHPKLVEVLREQATQLWHTSNLYNIPNQQALADRLVEHTFADTVFSPTRVPKAWNVPSKWRASTSAILGSRTVQSYRL